MLKGIDFIKILKIINLYKSCIVIKGKISKYKSYIRSRKYLLDLIYFNITRPFNYSCKGGKYFIIFLNNYNKYLEVKVLKKKSNIYIAFLYYIA